MGPKPNSATDALASPNPASRGTRTVSGERMRLDKFLKASRIIKRRSVANEACANGRATINGREAKPGKEVREGDIIAVRFGSAEFVARVLRVPKGDVPKSEAGTIYEVIEKRNAEKD